MAEFETLMNELPYSMEKFIETFCPYCRALYEINARYELKINVSLYTTNISVEKRYKVYYECPQVPNGSRQRYIGDPTGLGFLTIQEAIDDLKGYLNNDR